MIVMWHLHDRVCCLCVVGGMFGLRYHLRRDVRARSDGCTLDALSHSRITCFMSSKRMAPTKWSEPVLSPSAEPPWPADLVAHAGSSRLSTLAVSGNAGAAAERAETATEPLEPALPVMSEPPSESRPPEASRPAAPPGRPPGSRLACCSCCLSAAAAVLGGSRLATTRAADSTASEASEMATLAVRSHCVAACGSCAYSHRLVAWGAVAGYNGMCSCRLATCVWQQARQRLGPVRLVYAETVIL